MPRGPHVWGGIERNIGSKLIYLYIALFFEGHEAVACTLACR